MVTAVLLLLIAAMCLTGAFFLYLAWPFEPRKKYGDLCPPMKKDGYRYHFHQLQLGEGIDSLVQRLTGHVAFETEVNDLGELYGIFVRVVENRVEVVTRRSLRENYERPGATPARFPAPPAAERSVPALHREQRLPRAVSTGNVGELRAGPDTDRETFYLDMKKSFDQQQWNKYHRYRSQGYSDNAAVGRVLDNDSLPYYTFTMS